jgi:hypothetical protein
MRTPTTLGVIENKDDPIVTVLLAVPASRLADLYKLAAAAMEGRDNPRRPQWTPEARAAQSQRTRQRWEAKNGQ